MVLNTSSKKKNVLNDAFFPLFFRRHFDWPEKFTLPDSLRTQGFPVRESLLNVALSCSFKSNSVSKSVCYGTEQNVAKYDIKYSSKKKLIK